MRPNSSLSGVALPKAEGFNNLTSHFSSSTPRRFRAFTLVEILVTVGLLSFIILGLLAMFSQTQRAFTASMTQTDVLETGRAATDMLVRDLEQVTPAELPCPQTVTLPRPFPGYYALSTNFFAELSPQFNPPLRQGLPGTTRGGVQLSRTNFVENFFFLSRQNQDWVGTGYAVIPAYANAGVGTLYRFSATASKLSTTNPVCLSGLFQAALQNAWQNTQQGLSVTNMSRVADGIIHLRLRTFATNGFPIYSDGNIRNAYFRAGPFGTSFATVQQASTLPNLSYQDFLSGVYFWSNAVPASLELELGVLEPQVFQRYNSIASGLAIPPPLPTQNNQRNYLSNHVAQVHLFRQRIPVRNVDFTAYQ